MAKKSTSSTTNSTVSVQSVDEAVETQNIDVMDINLATQSVTETPTPAKETKSVDSSTKQDNTTEVVTPVKSAIPVFDQEGTLSYKLKLATGVRYDLDKMVADCDGNKEALHRAYNKVSWHLGRIRSCSDSTHIAHQGRYDADGNESTLLTEIKTLFSEK